MLIKSLRQKKCISQEQLAEMTGLSLRTIQRVESGQRVGNSSLRSLAEFFKIDVESFELGDNGMADSTDSTPEKLPDNLVYHRAAQLIIFIVTFFVCVSQWLAYYAYLNPGPSDASLGTILTYVAEISLGAAIFTYIFNYAKVTFYRCYYLVAAMFMVFAVSIGYWTEAFVDSPSYQLLTPVFFTLMLLALLLIHVMQMALSLKAETAVLVQNQRRRQSLNLAN